MIQGSVLPMGSPVLRLPFCFFSLVNLYLSPQSLRLSGPGNWLQIDWSNVSVAIERLQKRHLAFWFHFLGTMTTRKSIYLASLFPQKNVLI